MTKVQVLNSTIYETGSNITYVSEGEASKGTIRARYSVTNYSRLYWLPWDRHLAFLILVAEATCRVFVRCYSHLVAM